MKRIKNLINLYNKLRLPVKASIWFVFCSVFQKGVQFFFTPFLTRLLSTEQYGQYSVFLSWYDILSIFATLNLSYYVINNGMTKFEDDREGFVLSLQSLGICSTLICLLLYIPFYSIWEKLTGMSLAIMLPMFAEFFIRPSFDLYQQKLKYDYNFRPVLILTILAWILIPICSILFILNMRERGLAAIYGRILGFCIVSGIAAILLFKKKQKFIQLKYWIFALKFNLPLILHFLSGIVLVAADRIMIERMFSDREAGIYSLAYSIASVPQIINGAINASFIPFTYKELKKGSTTRIRKYATILTLGMAAINLAVILVAPELIRILGTEEYYDASYVIPMIAISGLLIFMFNLFVNIEYYYEENKFVPVASVFAALINIILNFILMQRFSYMVAGGTTLFTYIVYTIGHAFFMRRTLNKHTGAVRLYDMKLFVAIAVCSIGISIMLILTYPYWWLRYTLVLVLIIVAYVKRKIILSLINSFKEK